MAEVAGFLATAIPNASVIEQMGIQRSPIADFAPNSPTTIATSACGPTSPNGSGTDQRAVREPASGGGV